jgi:3-hydroxyisobutyrate dehydrogenase-like beta-hydroxyacid dehydrogenase
MTVIASNTKPLAITVIGTGMMGFPMARRLQGAGHTVSAWNRSLEKALPLRADGISVESQLHVAVANADVVITMLEHGDAVADVLFAQGGAQAIRPGAMVIDMSSIQPGQARLHAKEIQALQCDYLDAPVSGGTLGAEAGTLAIMVGGSEAAFERAAPAFTPLGRATRVGPVGSGQLAKLANQMIVGITIGAVAEALLMCEKGGADMGQVKAAISGGFADSRILQVHGQRMVNRDFAPRGRMAIQLKDMRNALQTATQLGFEAPITHALEALYAAGVSHGDAGLDQSALFCELARRNAMR